MIEYINKLFQYLEYISDFFWSYIGFSLICIIGIYLTLKSKGLQFRTIRNVKNNIQEFSSHASQREGLNPIKLFFASAGGSVGLGNVVGIGIAVMIGGIGSIFWMWIASFAGMLLRYSEIFLGMKYRQKNNKFGFDGGPMYYLQAAFKSKIPAYLAAIFLCIYGVEIYQFVVLTDRLHIAFDVNRNLILFLILISVIYSVLGGVKRIANICSYLMPIFMLSYIFMCMYVIFCNYTNIWHTIKQIFYTAFNGQAPLGGFIGSTWLMSAYLGISKTVYSGDICIGYDSVVQSETRISNPKAQAKIAIYSMLADTIICFFSTFVLAVTGSWWKLNHIIESDVMSTLLTQYFPNSHHFMTAVIFFAGYTTVIAYLVVGIKSAKFIFPKWGEKVYIIYACCSFIFFSYFSQTQVMVVMSFTSGVLVLINILGFWKLRKEIEF